MAFSIMTLTIRGLFVTLCIKRLCHYKVFYPECRIVFMVMLNAIILNVIVLSVMAPQLDIL
jgi:hypothetical protein